MYNNFLRYQNDTMCNMMFDVQASKPAYAKLNSIISQRNFIFYLSTGTLHTTAFMYLSFLMRFRRLSALPVLAIGTVYFSFFQNTNNIMYKLIVDRHVIKASRELGFEA